MRSAGLALALVVALLGAAATHAQERWVEAAGVARAEPGEGKGGPGRAAALRAALSEAVHQVAVELLTASETAPGKPPPDAAAIEEKVSRALGGDPSAYVSRYQIREDRGVQPRLLLADPDAKAEYQLVVMAQVDVAKVRQRVGARASALTPPAAQTTPTGEKPAPGEGAEQEKEAETGAAMEGSVTSFDLELDGIATYREYAAVRDALTSKLGARKVEPQEFTRGRVLLAVASPVPAPELGAALNKALDGRVAVDTVPPAAGAPEGRLHLRIRSVPLQAPSAAMPASPPKPAPPAPGARPAGLTR